MAYEFIIKNETTRKKKNKAVAGQTDGGSSPQQAAQSGGGKESLLAGLVAWQKVKPWVNRVASHNVNMVELRTGSRDLQQRYSFAYQIATDTANLAESVLMGFAVGNVAGAVVGGLMSVAGKIINIVQRQDEINTKQSIENVSVQMNYIRAGAGGRRT